jgi:hypothetical protein
MQSGYSDCSICTIAALTSRLLQFKLKTESEVVAILDTTFSPSASIPGMEANFNG